MGLTTEQIEPSPGDLATRGPVFHGFLVRGVIGQSQSVWQSRIVRLSHQNGFGTFVEVKATSASWREVLLR